MYTPSLREYIKLVILSENRKSKIREVDISGDRKVPHGCDAHIKDLEERIKEIEYWRDKTPRRSVKRYHWITVLRQLREELRSAKRANQNAINEKDEV